MSLVKAYTLPIVGRLFVVGDIHGCYDLLMKRLAEINFNFEKDLLVSVGDLVDRGQQSFDCVAFLLGKSWFLAVRGNHEQFCIDGHANYNIARNHVSNGGEWFYKRDSNTQRNIVNAFELLPIALEITFQYKKYGFVHAHVEQNDWEEFKHELLNGDDSLRSAASMALWSRERVYQPSNEDTYQVIKNIDEVYLGHTILPKPMRKHNCIFIDTGAYHTGNLTIIQLGFDPIENIVQKNV